MKAVIHYGVSGINGISIQNVKKDKPKPGNVQVRIKAAGLNHRDLFLMKERKEDLDKPVIPGSDGAGIVEAVGDGVQHIQVGDEVIINPTLNWMHASNVPENLEILGIPTDGTFAESAIIPAENVEKKPSFLSWEEAGVLPLAALTAFRALFTRGQVRKGEHVLIPGIGGGVATYALTMAKAIGAKVTVTSRSEEKLKHALEMGADNAIYSNSDWNKSLKGELVDLIIDSIGPAVFPKFLSVLRPGGRIVQFGRTTGDQVEISLSLFFRNQFSFLATSMGSKEEFKDMLHFIEEHRIRPVIDQVYPLDKAVQAFKRMEEGNQFGNICLTI